MTQHELRGYWSRLIALAVLAASLLPFQPPRAVAQEAGDPAAGHRLAETWCSSCHAIDPAPQRRNDYGAPAFVAVAALPSTTPMALAAFLQTPHSQMPDLHLSRNEIDDLTSYILSLRHK